MTHLAAHHQRIRTCHPISMRTAIRNLPETCPSRNFQSPAKLWRFFLICSLCLLALFGVRWPRQPGPGSYGRTKSGRSPSSDTGAAGLKQMLVRLQTTARLMQTTAHPDDEDGGMLTLESRGHGVTTLLMTLTRGEGGQNKVGSNLFDVLGVLRALELTASDRYYGVEQRFSRVADFGYSKNPEETFQKWGGHDIALGDMVRVIRTFRPDVLVARFSGTERDGMDTIKPRPFSPRKHFARPRTRTGFRIRSRRACNPGRQKNYTSAMYAALARRPARGKLYRQVEYRPGESAIAGSHTSSSPWTDCGISFRRERAAGRSSPEIALPTTSWWIRLCPRPPTKTVTRRIFLTALIPAGKVWRRVRRGRSERPGENCKQG